MLGVSLHPLLEHLEEERHPDLVLQSVLILAAQREVKGPLHLLFVDGNAHIVGGREEFGKINDSLILRLLLEFEQQFMECLRLGIAPNDSGFEPISIRKQLGERSVERGGWSLEAIHWRRRRAVSPQRSVHKLDERRDGDCARFGIRNAIKNMLDFIERTLGVNVGDGVVETLEVEIASVLVIAIHQNDLHRAKQRHSGCDQQRGRSRGQRVDRQRSRVSADTVFVRGKGSRVRAMAPTLHWFRAVSRRLTARTEDGRRQSIQFQTLNLLQNVVDELFEILHSQRMQNGSGSLFQYPPRGTLTHRGRGHFAVFALTDFVSTVFIDSVHREEPRKDCWTKQSGFVFELETVSTIILRSKS